MDTSLTSIGASSDTASGVNKGDPSSHSLVSEGSRSGAGLRTIASVVRLPASYASPVQLNAHSCCRAWQLQRAQSAVHTASTTNSDTLHVQAGSLNFLRRKKSAAPLVTLFADVDMLSSPTSDMSNAAGPSGASLAAAPGGSLILRSTSTADEAGTNGTHSPSTPPCSAAPQGETLVGGGSAPEARQRGGRPRHSWTPSAQAQRPAGGAPQPPAVIMPQASEMGAAGSAWGSPVQVSHTHRRSAAGRPPPPAHPQDGALAAVVEPANVLDSPATHGHTGMPVHVSSGPSHSGGVGNGRSVPSMPVLPAIPKRSGSPDLDMGIMPPPSPLVRTHAASQGQQRSRAEQEAAWRSQPPELGGVPAQPATGKTVGTDGGM